MTDSRMDAEEILDLDDVVRTILGLEPQAFVELGGQRPSKHDKAAGSTCRVGLNIFVRRVLTVYLSLLSQENAVLRLETEHSAKAAGWPDSRTANLAILLTWGLIGEDRKLLGLPVVPLLRADATLTPMIQQRPPTQLEPASVLVSKVAAPPPLSIEKGDRGEALWANPEPFPDAVESTNEIIRDLLGLDPRLLAKAVRWYRNKPDSFFDQDAERTGWAGLNKLLRDVVTTYAIMERRRTEEVRLMSEHDARVAGRPDARSANFATMLAVGLMCEDGWDVMIFRARDYSQAREDLLKAMAREVMESKSMFACEGFRMICDGMVHFGVYDNGDLGSRLIEAAYMETKAAALSKTRKA